MNIRTTSDQRGICPAAMFVYVRAKVGMSATATMFCAIVNVAYNYYMSFLFVPLCSILIFFFPFYFACLAISWLFHAFYISLSSLLLSLCNCFCFCLSLFLCISVSGFHFLCLLIRVCMSLSLCLSVSFFSPLYLSMFIFIFLSVYLSLFLSVFPFSRVSA